MISPVSRLAARCSPPLLIFSDMATTKRSKPNPSTNPIALQHDPVNPTPVDFEPAALALIALCFAGDLEGATAAVQGGTQCWVQDSEGSTALHAAAGSSQLFVHLDLLVELGGSRADGCGTGTASGNTELVTFLLRKGNAVWNLTDNLGYVRPFPPLSSVHADAVGG